MALPRVSNKKRLIVLLGMVAFIFLLLVVRIGYIVFVQGEWLQEKAENQWTLDSPVSAKRGAILDRNGNVLAQSASADTVVLWPNEVENPNLVAEQLSEMLEMDYNEVYTKASDTSKAEVWLKRQIEREVKNDILALNLKGVHFTEDMKRYYPNRSFLTQVIGFTSVDGNGLEGLEARYDKYLAGQPGRIVTEKDAGGEELMFGGQVYIEPQDGYNLVLTVDECLQSFLENAMEEAYEQTSAVSVQGIVMDPSTGEILALGNMPDYDLNDPPRDDTELLQQLTRNRVITDVYEPGSTFKVVTTSAALDSGAVAMDTHFNCIGYKIVDGQKIKCWRSYNPHGDQDLKEAVQNSCNPCFMEMALNMGTETFYDYIYAFGFGNKTGIDFTADQTGIVRAEKYIKNVDLARIGFGQSIAVTPLQLATAACTVVNGGNLMKPYLVKRFEDSEGKVIKDFEPELVRQVISEDTSAKMREILESVVTDGSGKNCYIEGYRIGGKTGTAQKYDDEGNVLQDKHIASFIGFAPADDPQLLVMLVVDEPDVAVDFGSVVAAPYVKQILEESLKYMNIMPVYDDGDAEQMITVPDVQGMQLSDAQTALKNANLLCLADGTGKVVDQMPAPGAEVYKKTTVLLYMQYENEYEEQDGKVTVPDIKNKSIMAAAETLQNCGLRLEIHGSGVATYQQPAAGELVDPDTVVSVQFGQP